MLHANREIHRCFSNPNWLLQRLCHVVYCLHFSCTSLIGLQVSSLYYSHGIAHYVFKKTQARYTTIHKIKTALTSDLVFAFVLETQLSTRFVNFGVIILQYTHILTTPSSKNRCSKTYISPRFSAFSIYFRFIFRPHFSIQQRFVFLDGEIRPIFHGPKICIQQLKTSFLSLFSPVRSLI